MSSAIDSLASRPRARSSAPERKGYGSCGSGAEAICVAAVPDDEPAADREPGLVGERLALPVSRDEAHGVGMARRRRHGVEGDGPLGVEDDYSLAGKVERFRLAHPRNERFDGVRIDGLRRFAAQAQDHSLIGRVAAPGEGE